MSSKMKKAALICIIKDPSSEELKQVHRLLSIQTVSVERPPTAGEDFKPLTDCGRSQVFRCLRVEDKSSPGSDSVDGHEFIIYGEISHHVS